jgi:ABC-type glutathione transport system ATPase component
MLVSHSSQQIAKLCSRAIWLDGGAIAADGPPDDVLAAYEQKYADLEAEDDLTEDEDRESRPAERRKRDKRRPPQRAA